MPLGDNVADMAQWTWVLHDRDGNDIRSTEPFESKETAESWMGDHWSELLDEGAETVSLMQDAKREYRMGLRAE